MKIQQKVAKIKEIIAPVLNQHETELVDIELVGAVGNQVLRIFVDTDAGITLTQCAELSREISVLLDINDIINGKYRLDVSSPGIERPLTTARSFRRNIDRDVCITMTDNTTVDGLILAVDNERLVLKTRNEEKEIPLSRIERGKIKLKW